MICNKEDVIIWFKQSESYKRIDTMCTLLNMCLPFELRFLGTCLEELGRRDSQELRGIELRVNNPLELAADIATCQLGEPTDKKVRRKMALYLALIRACSSQCVNAIFNTLDGWGERDFRNFDDDDQLQELLLVYTMANYHPVFSFDQRMKCGEIYNKLKDMIQTTTISADNMTTVTTLQPSSHFTEQQQQQQQMMHHQLQPQHLQRTTIPGTMESSPPPPPPTLSATTSPHNSLPVMNPIIPATPIHIGFTQLMPESIVPPAPPPPINIDNISQIPLQQQQQPPPPHTIPIQDYIISNVTQPPLPALQSANALPWTARHNIMHTSFPPPTLDMSGQPPSSLSQSQLSQSSSSSIIPRSTSSSSPGLRSQQSSPIHSRTSSPIRLSNVTTTYQQQSTNSRNQHQQRQSSTGPQSLPPQTTQSSSSSQQQQQQNPSLSSSSSSSTSSSSSSSSSSASTSSNPIQQQQSAHPIIANRRPSSDISTPSPPQQILGVLNHNDIILAQNHKIYEDSSPLNVEALSQINLLQHRNGYRQMPGSLPRHTSKAYSHHYQPIQQQQQQQQPHPLHHHHHQQQHHQQPHQHLLHQQHLNNFNPSSINYSLQNMTINDLEQSNNIDVIGKSGGSDSGSSMGSIGDLSPPDTPALITHHSNTTITTTTTGTGTTTTPHTINNYRLKEPMYNKSINRRLIDKHGPNNLMYVSSSTATANIMHQQQHSQSSQQQQQQLQQQQQQPYSVSGDISSINNNSNSNIGNNNNNIGNINNSNNIAASTVLLSQQQQQQQQQQLQSTMTGVNPVVLQTTNPAALILHQPQQQQPQQQHQHQNVHQTQFNNVFPYHQTQSLASVNLPRSGLIQQPPQTSSYRHHQVQQSQQQPQISTLPPLALPYFHHQSHISSNPEFAYMYPTLGTTSGENCIPDPTIAFLTQDLAPPPPPPPSSINMPLEAQLIQQNRITPPINLSMPPIPDPMLTSTSSSSSSSTSTALLSNSIHLSDAAPNAYPSNVNINHHHHHITKILSCFNCGSQMHAGVDCPEISMEEVTRSSTYKLDYNSILSSSSSLASSSSSLISSSSSSSASSLAFASPMSISTASPLSAIASSLSTTTLGTSITSLPITIQKTTEILPSSTNQTSSDDLPVDGNNNNNNEDSTTSSNVMDKNDNENNKIMSTSSSTTQQGTNVTSYMATSISESDGNNVSSSSSSSSSAAAATSFATIATDTTTSASVVSSASASSTSRPSSPSTSPAMPVVTLI